jgi:hypothetical protein
MSLQASALPVVREPKTTPKRTGNKSNTPLLVVPLAASTPAAASRAMGVPFRVRQRDDSSPPLLLALLGVLRDCAEIVPEPRGAPVQGPAHLVYD